MSNKPLRVRGVSPFDLFFTRCRTCSHVTLHGFWHQLSRDMDTARKRVRVRLSCESCGRDASRTYRLTTGRPERHRLCPWLSLLVWISPFLLRYSHRHWPGRVARALMWLERRFPL